MRLICCAAFLLSLLTGSDAAASVITFDFGVSVNAVFGVPGVSPGDVLVGSYTFDSATPDAAAPADTGTYFSTLGFQFNVDGFSFNSPNFLIGIADNVVTPSGTQDYYTPQGGDADEFFSIFLATFIDLTAITSDSLSRGATRSLTV